MISPCPKILLEHALRNLVDVGRVMMEHQEPVSHTILHKLNVISYAQRTFADYTAPSALRRQQPQEIF
jgi:hypothetical protein